MPSIVDGLREASSASGLSAAGNPDWSAASVAFVALADVALLENNETPEFSPLIRSSSTTGATALSGLGTSAGMAAGKGLAGGSPRSRRGGAPPIATWTGCSFWVECHPMCPVKNNQMNTIPAANTPTHASFFHGLGGASSGAKPWSSGGVAALTWDAQG